MKNAIKISPHGNLLVDREGYTMDFVRSTIQKKQLRGLRIFADLKEDRLNDLKFLPNTLFWKPWISQALTITI